MLKNKFFIEQLDQKLQPFVDAGRNSVPPHGWVNALRTALNMSLRQLGKRLSVTPQGAKAIEKREIDGTLTLKYLRDAAKAMEMTFVYGFIPNDGSLEKLLNRKTREKAEKTLRSRLTDKRFPPTEKSIRAGTEALREKLPRELWD
jgi:predicted DNA-binding mobile mystery protein A